MCKFRVQRRLIFCALVINVVLIIVLNIYYLNKTELLPDFSVNASKYFIEKFVPAKPKRVLVFEIGRPKPEGKVTSCRFTQSTGLQALAEMYLSPKAKNVGKCSTTYETICTVSGSLHSSKSGHGSVSVNCEQNPCGDTVKFGSLLKENGNIQWEDVKSTHLESFITTVGLKNINFMYPFFFLKCGENKSSQHRPQFTQMLTVSVAVNQNKSASNGQTFNKETINVNIVFVDSISRRHFYRSLPNTIEAFRMINLNPKSTSNVLDFELYQAMAGASGRGLLQFLAAKKTGKSLKAVKAVDLLFSHFKHAGYQTVWQEDLCWKLGHGFVQYFGVNGLKRKDRWQNIQQAMKMNEIDSLGVTHSSCHAFKENKVFSMDGYGKRSICVNGKLQHEYFLDYLVKHLSEVDNDKSLKPLFSFTSLNLGNEESGTHVQILDEALAGFVRKMAADKNTITVLISDHGNNYDSFPVQTNEGQYEQYNPFLFMILPGFVKRKLGEDMENLLNNQPRLISMFDIYNTIKSLVDDQKKSNVTQDKGLFKGIDFDRDCERFDLSSSLCICDGWKSNQTPAVFHLIIAEFALGQLNNMIADQYLNQNSRNKEVAFSQCERLNGLHVRNISQKRIQNGYIEAQMDIYVQKSVVFAVKVNWHGDNSPAMGMTLVNYHRKKGARHTSCSTYVDKDLCICRDNAQTLNALNWKRYSSVFNHKTKSENRHSHCLYILTRDYTDNTVFEASNICENVQYSIYINFEMENMRTPTKIPINATISSKSIRFLTFVTPLHLKNPGTWEYEITMTYSK